MENKKLKKPGIREQFNQGPEQQSEGGAQKTPMTKEETMKFYEENLPFMKMQDEYEKLALSFADRKVAHLELQVRELEAIGYLSQWKAGQDEAKKRHEQEEQMKAEWDAMTPEQQDEYRKQAEANLAEMQRQAAEAGKQSTATEQEQFDHPLM
jgi:hypothetical protein